MTWVHTWRRGSPGSIRSVSAACSSSTVRIRGSGGDGRSPDSINEIWYQTFHQQPWAASLVGENRKTCEGYFRHFLDHWSHEPGIFDEDLDLWVDNFMKPGNLQGGFDWYISTTSRGWISSATARLSCRR